MNFASAIPPDELLLARLTAAKLAKVMHGLMSVGTGSLGFDPPSDFLAGRDKTPLGFLAVLSCIGVYAEHSDKMLLLRQQVQDLADLTSRFHSLFMRLVHWRSMSPEDISATVSLLGDSYSQFCEQLGVFCAQLGMDIDYSSQARQDRSMLEAFFQMAAAHQL